MKTLRISSPSELPGVASEIIETLQGRTVILLLGPMGAGKTTLTASLAEALGAEKQEVASPTFAIINEYEGARGPIYHFDLYRLESAEDCLEIGMEDYLHSGSVCIIEWPEVATPLLPEDAMKVSIEVEADGSRKFTID